MGIPLYAIAWQGVTSEEWNGYLQWASSDPPRGTWGDGGDLDYWHLMDEIFAEHERHWDDEAKVPFLFNRTTGSWISYEDLRSLQWKMKYIRENRLAGIFFWEISKDRQGQLISAAFRQLKKEGVEIVHASCR